MDATQSERLPSAEDYLMMMEANNWVEMGYSAIVKYFKSSSHATRRILDLGCGPGIFTHHLANVLEADALGIDPSVDMIDVADRRFSSAGVRFEAGNPQDLVDQFAGRFDAVVSCFVLMHLPTADSHHDLAECAHRALNETGQAIFLDMNPASVGIQFRSVRNGEPGVKYNAGDPMVTSVRTPEGIQQVRDIYWPAEHYLQAVEAVGFSIVEHRTLPPPPGDNTPYDQFTMIIAEKR